MEQLLASNDFILGLKAKGECVTDARYQRRPCLTQWRLVNILRDPGPRRKQRTQALRVGSLSKNTRVRNFDNATDFNEALLARKGTPCRTPTCDKSLTV